MVGDIEEILESQKEFFKSGVTHDVLFRKSQLKKLRDSIVSNREYILSALEKDLSKPRLETYTSEIGTVLSEIDYMIKHLGKWTRKKKKRTSIINFPSVSYTIDCPYGLTLIISPWNYPFNLAMGPLIGAVAGGNCVVLKPSEYSSCTTKIIEKIICECFKKEYVTVVKGGRETNELLLSKNFDYIFFTGSTKVGRVVMEAAAKNLTPVTLELGGKSPCIVLKDANLRVAARRIAWGKFINSGQTCIAPDYLLVEKGIKEKLTLELRDALKEFFGENPLKSSDYCKIITREHFLRLVNYLNDSKIVLGGRYDVENRKIEPTLLEDVSLCDDIMNEEVFGPLLPIIEFTSVDEAIEVVEKNPTPLSLYIFTENKDIEKRVIERVSFGGGCINDTIMHISSNHLPFGGVGRSGMGKYHGRWSFETFTHKKSILKKATWLDLSFRYPPYKDKLKWVEKIYK